MKTMKRTLSVLLAMMMALALAIPAFAAAPTYTITINNDQAGHTYEAYQIFAGDVASDEPTDGSTNGPILSNIIWGNGVNGEALLDALKKADAEKYENCTTAADVAEALGAAGATAEDAAAFAQIAAEHLTTNHTDSIYNEGTKTYTINGLAGGYYLVKDKDGELAGDAATATDYIVQVLGNVTMEPKDSDIPTVEKKVSEEDYTVAENPYGTTYNDVADWDIGDSVPFKLIGSIPDMSAFDTYEYIFTDTLSNGLTLQTDTIKVYIARAKNDEVRDYTPLTKGEDYDLNDQNLGENGGGSFSIIFDDLKTNKYLTGENKDEYNFVIVTYDATLNANAEIGLPGNPNEVYLQFSNDPNGDGLGQTAKDTVIVFTYELDGTKVDAANPKTKLQDAQFVLFNGGMTRVASIVDGKIAGWIEPDTINPDVEGNNDTEKMQNLTSEDFRNYNEGSLIITSGADGTFKIAGLDDGTYLLREIKAPAGYNLLDGDLKVTVSADTANGQNWDGQAATALTDLTVTTQLGEDGAPTNGEGNVNTGIVAITVTNNQGALLPETGGMGTTIFYIIGGVLVLGVVVILVARKRAER